MNGPERHRELPVMALILTGLLSPGLVQPAAAGPAQPLVLERKIPLGEVRGRIDHLAVDLDRDRLFVAELGNDSLGVVDLAAGRLLRRIGELDEPQGVAYDPATDTVYVADGEGALALISAASGELEAQIRLPGHPESFQLERRGPRIFVNVPDAHQIAVVDRTTGQQVASWGMADAQANFPMALDEANGRLVIVYRDPALLAVFDTGSGAPLAHLPACGDTDDVFLDSQRHRLYLSCGAGFLDVIEQRGDTYEELARIPTVAGARTALFAPERDSLYLAVRASGSEGAA